MTDMPNEQHSPPLSEILRKVTADIEEGKPIREQAAQEVALPEPPASPMAVHHEKLAAMINTACAVALESGRLAVEREHAAMRAIQQRRDHVHEVLGEYLQLVEAVMQNDRVVSDAYEQLERLFASPTVIEPAPGKPSKNNGKRG